MRALTARPDYVDAQVGLKFSGQKTIDILQSEFFKAFNSGDKKTAVYTFIEMRNFRDRVVAFKIDVSYSSMYADDFEQVKAEYLSERFTAANALLDKEEFAASEIIFNEIMVLEPNYKDAASLRKYARIEPVYRKGTEAMKKEKYRKAYYAFYEVVKQQDDYKDAKTLMEESLKEAQYTIAFLNFENVTYERGAADRISAKIMNDVLQNKGPFLKIIDRQNLDILLKEQKLAMVGVVDESTAANAGNIIGAKAVLIGKLLEVKVSEVPLSSQRIKAYESYFIKKLNPQTGQYYNETAYKKVIYTDYSGSRQVSCSFQYKLISAETGEILLSDIISRTEVSSVHYAYYDGDYTLLCPGTWQSLNQSSSSDVIHNGNSEKQQLQALFKAPKVLETKDAMLSTLYDKIGSAAARAVYSYNPEN
ncbi:MAG: CsgG/HfaB family protein [Flavobacteriales bacterium]